MQGWVWGSPHPKSITFFLDNTCIVSDQYGRVIKRAVNQDGVELKFADCPPEASREGTVMPRPQFATHQQVIEALRAEGINWLAYEVKYRDRAGASKVRSNLSLIEAGKTQARLLQDGCTFVIIDRVISCAGWPQLPYDELKKLPELPPTPDEELKKIRDVALRRDARRIRREADEAMQSEMLVESEE